MHWIKRRGYLGLSFSKALVRLVSKNTDSKTWEIIESKTFNTYLIYLLMPGKPVQISVLKIYSINREKGEVDKK